MPGAALLSRSFGALLVANVCFGYAFSSFFLLPIYMVDRLGAGPVAVGRVFAIHSVVVVLVLPLTGAAVDRWGRRDFLTAGALVMALASLGYGAVDAVGPLLYGLRVVQALAFALVFAAGGALAVDLAPPERLGQAIGIYGVSFLSMNAIAPAAVELLVPRVGWARAFALAAVAAGLCAGLSRQIREPRSAEGRRGDDTGLFAMATRFSTLRMLLVIALVGSAMIAVFAFYQLYARQLGIERVSVFFVAYAATAVIVRVGFGHWIDRLGRRRVSIAALVLYVVVMGSFVSLDRIGLPLLGVGMGIAHGVFYPSFNAVAVGAVALGERGKVMALFQAAFQSGMAVGGLGFGLLASRAGYASVFQAAALGLALALVVLLFSPEERAQPVA